MNAPEIARLIRLVGACCPSQRFDEYTPDAWILLLHDVDYEDAKTVVVDLARTQPRDGGTRYIDPAAIIAGVRKLREERVRTHPPVDPPPGLGEDPRAFIAWLTDVRARQASGEIISGELPANPAGQARYRQLAAGVGRGIE